MASCCPMCKIGPSILNTDLSCLAAECKKLLENGADYLHLDVMDGHFVPNITFGAPLVKCLRKKIGPDVFFDMHMMVAKPEQGLVTWRNFSPAWDNQLLMYGKEWNNVNTKWIKDMADAGANQYTFHLEATDKPLEVIQMIKDAGMKRILLVKRGAPEKVGIGIKPGTPVEGVLPFVDLVDMVLVMTVEPGFGGQKFMADMMPKVSHLRNIYKSLDIEVDGGVGPKNIDTAAEAGANMIVSGSAIVSSDQPGQIISLLRKSVTNWTEINWSKT